MSIPSILTWIESTDLSTAIREGGLPYPIIGGIHVVSIAWFGGMLLATDLRLLGWAMWRRPVSDVVRQLQPWKRLGFVIVVATGLLLTWSEPVRLYGSPSFWVKIVLFALVGVHALVFRAGVYQDPSKLDASATFTQADGTFPNGTHLAEVEIDPATGIIRIVNYVIVDDFGVTLNPLLLAGQVHGGAMQGIGQALMEQAVYSSSDGQLVTGTFMDYALPRASDGPAFVFETSNVPCKTNPLGVKGAGEAGAIGSCPAVVNAIIEGLHREYEIGHIDMPATAERIWIAIREAQRRHNL